MNLVGCYTKCKPRRASYLVYKRVAGSDHVVTVMSSYTKYLQLSKVHLVKEEELTLRQVRAVFRSGRKIVVLAGAGISVGAGGEASIHVQ